MTWHVCDLFLVMQRKYRTGSSKPRQKREPPARLVLWPIVQGEYFVS